MAKNPNRTGLPPGKHNPLTEDEKHVYVSVVAAGRTKKAAADAAGRRRCTFNDEKKRDPEFAAAVDRAYFEDGRDSLVEVATCRFVDGWEEPVYQKGELVGFIRKYDNRLGEFLIKQRDPTFRDRISVEQTGKDGGPVEVVHRDAIDVEISRLLGVLGARDEAGAAGEVAPETVGL